MPLGRMLGNSTATTDNKQVPFVLVITGVVAHVDSRMGFRSHPSPSTPRRVPRSVMVHMAVKRLVPQFLMIVAACSEIEGLGAYRIHTHVLPVMAQPSLQTSSLPWARSGLARTLQTHIIRRKTVLLDTG